MKRFWTSVSVAANEAGGGYRVLLDDRDVKTPMRRLLEVPTPRLAEAIAGEWRAQEDEVDSASMPITMLSYTAIDHVRAEREAVVDQVAAYAGTDLLCYRADRPDVLVERQERVWQPLLDWAAVRFDASLIVTTGVIPVAQSDVALGAIRQAAAALDDMRLTVLHAATGPAGSVVLGLALVHGHLDAAAVAEASQLDERFQAEQWGEDDEAAARRIALENEINTAARFLDLLKEESSKG
jgi:chaperone required for assembly of F1-ATPase